jgi:hypothetical protein
MPYCPSCGQNHAQTGGAPAARGLSYTEQLRRSANHPLSGLLTADVHAASMYAAHTAGVQPFGGLVTPDVHAASALAHLGGADGAAMAALRQQGTSPVRTAAPLAFNAAALRAPARATLNPAQRAKLGPFDASIPFAWNLPPGIAPSIPGNGGSQAIMAFVSGRQFRPTGISWEFDANGAAAMPDVVRAGRNIVWPPSSANVPAQTQNANAAAMYQTRVNGLMAPIADGFYSISVPLDLKPIVLGGGMPFTIEFKNGSPQTISLPRNVTLYGVLG